MTPTSNIFRFIEKRLENSEVSQLTELAKLSHIQIDRLQIFQCTFNNISTANIII